MGRVRKGMDDGGGGRGKFTIWLRLWIAGERD